MEMMSLTFALVVLTSAQVSKYAASLEDVQVTTVLGRYNMINS